MNPGRYEYMPMGGWTYMDYSGESTTDRRKREDRDRSRAAIPRRRNTRRSSR
jgi:hypothetical protein